MLLLAVDDRKSVAHISHEGYVKDFRTVTMAPGQKSSFFKMIKEKFLGVSDPTPIGNGGCTTYDKHRHSGYLGSPTPITNGNVHVLRQNGGKCSTLPRSNRRNTTQISYYEVQEAATHNRPILKSSPVKLIPPGRIEVIKEEVEIEVATNSCLKSTMHRSVEGSQIPSSIPPPKYPAVLSPNLLSPSRTSSQHVPFPLQSGGGIDFPTYSEPVIVPTTIASKLRPDFYHESQGPYVSYNDDDPGVMSEADTTATGFRRGGRGRSSLPVVRTPSKTLEKPLGVVFLQYREETKRGVLPNEITTVDTVKALFVRAFPKLLSMQYLDCSGKCKIYILDQRKDMFYELEDLRDIRDRSVLKIFESDQLATSSSLYGASFSPLAYPIIDESNYYSEPEFDTLRAADSFHYSGITSNPPRHPTSIRKGIMSQSHLPSSSSPYAPPPNVPPKPQRTNLYSYNSNSMSRDPYRIEWFVYSGFSTALYEEPVYSNLPEKRPPSRSGTATPIIDEEARYRVDAMEKHLANLTGLVQQALSGNNSPGGMNSRRIDPVKNTDYSNIYVAPKRNIAQKDPKSITTTSLTNGPTKLTKHATASADQSHPTENGTVFTRYPDPMLMEYLENLQRKVREMRGDARVLRRQHQSQALTMREIVKDNFERLKNQFNLVALPPYNQARSAFSAPSQRGRLSNETQTFQQDGLRLGRDLHNLERSVEEMKSGLDQEKQLSLRDIERYTTELSDLSNTVADLRLKFPDLQEKLKAVMTSDMEVVIKDEIFIKEEPEKLEDMAKRCKKLTGMLLNMNKLAAAKDLSSYGREDLVDLPPESTKPPQFTETIPQPPVRKESLTLSENSTPEHRQPNSTMDYRKPSSTGNFTVSQLDHLSPGSSTSSSNKMDKRAQDMLDDLLSELEIFTDTSSKEGTPDRDNTIKRSPKSAAKLPTTDTGFHDFNNSLSPPTITPSNSSQSTGTTVSSINESSSNFSGSDSVSTISKVQVGVGDLKTTISPVPLSNRSGGSSGISTPARKGSDAEKGLTAWFSAGNSPVPPPRSTSKSPLISPLSKTGGFFTLPNNYGRSTVSEPGDLQSDYVFSREQRSPSIKDQRLTPLQQDRIASYYTSKLRKGSDPGTAVSPIDEIASDILAFEASKSSYTRPDSGFASMKNDKRIPPVLPPRPGKEDPSVAPPLPPRNRQEILEERHQELLRKQRQLQEQYTRLQQLQRDQKIRPSSPVNKPSTNPQSGSLNDLKRQHLSKFGSSDLYAIPSSKPVHPQTPITNGSTNSQKIYETDIL